MTPELQIIVVFGLFLALLLLGMTVPFAISVPALVYLLLLGGTDALKGLGLVSWGSMNSFALSSIPLFILMAELMERSGLELTPAAQRLAQFNAVQNTYLGTFQVLGGLGLLLGFYRRDD